MSVDNIEAERALAYLLEDIATECQLIAGELGKQPFACVEERLRAICHALNDARYAGYTLAMGSPDTTMFLIERIKQFAGFNISAANAANELDRAAQHET